MPQTQTWTISDKLDQFAKAAELEKQGKIEEAWKLKYEVPIAPYLAKFYKEHLGLDNLLKAGFNLSEAISEYGSDFVTK